MIARLARWWAVVLTAFALRRGVSPERMLEAVMQSYTRHGSEWAMSVLNDAVLRNERRRVPVG